MSQEEIRVKHDTILLSDFDLIGVAFVNSEGKQILYIDFDRDAEEKPRLTVGISNAEGRLGSSLTVFDVPA